MRFLAKVTLPVEAGNRLCRDREMNAKFETLLSDVRPESIYFGIESGQRTLFCIVNVDSGQDLPRIAEPFWLGFEASVEFTPVMTQDEFKKAGPAIESAARKYSWTK